MEWFERKSVVEAPDGRRILVSTVENPMARETMCFVVGKGALGVYQEHHEEGMDLNKSHERIARGVADGSVALKDQEPTEDEVSEAFGDLILGSMDDEGAQQ